MKKTYKESKAILYIFPVNSIYYWVDIVLPCFINIFLRVPSQVITWLVDRSIFSLRVSQKKYSGLNLNNFKAIEAITLK